MDIEKEIKNLRRHVWANWIMIVLWFVFLQVALLYLIRFAEDVVQTNERLLDLKHRVEESERVRR